MTPASLHASYRRQLALLADRFDALDVPPSVIDRHRDGEIGGFLALAAPRAAEIRAKLNARGVQCDSRGSYLRLGPAPYVSDAQIDEAMAILGDSLI